MPRTQLPPTPAASGDIPGKDGPVNSSTEKPFNLPSPVITQGKSQVNATGPKLIQPAGDAGFSLPPPPTRSRTIIQMKPRSTQNEATERRPTSSGSRGSNKKAAGNATANTNGTTSKKMPSATSAAGKKIARKTAHSVIERRRRSKMNEEFAVLKSMIPACTDQEMHKLAILQASIDYLRYLEKCVKELKAANRSLSTPLLEAQVPRPVSHTSAPHSWHENQDGELEEEMDDNDDSSDAAMEDVGSTDITPALSAQTETPASAYTSPQSITVSPALEAPKRTHSSSYTSLSNLPSPVFEPQRYHHDAGHTTKDHPLGNHFSHSAAHPALSLSTSTSPTISPEVSIEQDQEATAALLMLNQDRRKPKYRSDHKGSRGLSVKDLLSC